ncbi:f6d5cff8-cbfa-480f-9e27-745d368ed426 [Sclerotinia trifoliorum]|uniref:chitinase n=1 Tax=Sclerotinia trifoliorum TaxID=28548 RepID=A0A8H2ZPP4_9HELO|nr:f6d5cff8-cbfa-480f-9e27-745d368ed426 [Sclerotinia trifoliorum]
MEVTTFEVSSNAQTQLSLQEFYDSYENNIMGRECSWVSLLLDDPPDPASLTVNGSIPVKQAGLNLHHFLRKYPPSPPVSDTEASGAEIPRKSYCTAITMWRSMDAMREWYTDFASQSEDYERLGHRLDQIRVFCENIEEIDSKVFDKVGDCYEISKPPQPRYWIVRNSLPRRNTACSLSTNSKNAKVSLERGWSGAPSQNNTSDVVSAAEELKTYVTLKEGNCGETSAFAYAGTVAIGIYAGSKIQDASSVLEDFIAEVTKNGVFDTLFVQHCAGNGLNSEYAFGIVARMDGSLADVQGMVKTWRDSGCINSYEGASTGKNVTINPPTQIDRSNYTSTNDTLTLSKDRRSLRQRDTCKTVVVASGDGYGTLADECGISAADFTTYNPSSTLFSTLAVGQHVCCSAGNLPNYSPQSNANGTCATYTFVTNDSCSQLAALNSITIDDIESFNRHTWSWMGCADLQAGYNICLSTGDPPMPATVANAVCGPQVPGTIQATSGLNFSLSTGTAAAGTNGRISNCGTEIIVGDPPAEFKKVGYWEGYNFDCPCLNKPITSINTTAGYTHVHLAFATITTDFEVDVSSIQEEFSDFLGMSGLGFKRILSFGGWDFSTNVATYQIFRDAMAPANSKTLAVNEYPGEPDIPGIPTRSLDDGVNYVRVFNELAAVLPAGTSQSVTASTSYWYLAPFLILEIRLIVNYVIYMTYDLHGQWDYGSAFSDASCPAGNCLRSRGNLTETLDSLSMITKAGVESNKVIVGVTSYGRSFQMTTPGCYLDSCTYTGPTSDAYAGACTQTPGYIANAEIDSIISRNATVLSTDGSSVGVTGTPFVHLDDSYSNIVVYNDDQWISYMNDANKIVRTALYRHYNFGGTADWAVDLQSYDEDNGSGSDGSSIVYVDQSIWTDGLSSTGVGASGGTIGTSDNLSLTCEPPCIVVLPHFHWEQPPLGRLPGDHIGCDSEFVLYNFPIQSVMPSSFIYTLLAFQQTFFPTAIPTTYGVAAGRNGETASASATASSSSSSSSTAVAAVIYLKWQAQPTTSTARHGTRQCEIFGCKPYCGLFGCDGGCGLFGCTGDCPLDLCGGLGCTGGAYRSTGSDNNNNDDCSDSVTASACTVIISSWSYSPMTEYSTTTKTECEETVACTAEDTRTTTTATKGYPVTTASMTGFYDSDPTSINTKYDAIASSIIQAGLKYYGLLQSTSTTMATASPTAKISTVTSDIVTAPTPETIVPQAVCILITNILWYNVQIITNGFETDSGAAIKKQEGGCGDLLSWEATNVSIPEGFATWTGTREYSFTLPLTIKAGYVEGYC